jgi:hypothetical protein
MRLWLVMCALTVAIPAGAQVPGHTGAGGVDPASAGSVGAGPAPLVGATNGAVRDEASGLHDATRSGAEHLADAATATVPTPRLVRVRAGARLHVARDTQCTDGTNRWDPAVSRGRYYCTAMGPGAAAVSSASVKD